MFACVFFSFPKNQYPDSEVLQLRVFDMLMSKRVNKRCRLSTSA